MTEREIIIDWLVGKPDDEAHPSFTRLAMIQMKVAEYSDEVFKVDCALGDAFDELFKRERGIKNSPALREYYNSLDAEAIVESFDGWCCHKYR